MDTPQDPRKDERSQAEAGEDLFDFDELLDSAPEILNELNAELDEVLAEAGLLDLMAPRVVEEEAQPVILDEVPAALPSPAPQVAEAPVPEPVAVASEPPAPVPESASAAVPAPMPVPAPVVASASDDSGGTGEIPLSDLFEADSTTASEIEEVQLQQPPSYPPPPPGVFDDPLPAAQEPALVTPVVPVEELLARSQAEDPLPEHPATEGVEKRGSMLPTWTHQHISLTKPALVVLVLFVLVNVVLVTLSWRSFRSVRGLVLDMGHKVIETTDEIRAEAEQRAKVYEEGATPIVSPEPEGYETLALAREAIERGEFDQARQALYALLAVVDRIELEARIDVEARASYLIADSWRLEADAHETRALRLERGAQ